MAANDVILLKSILSQRKSEDNSSLSDAEFFQLFSIDHILKDYDFSYDDIQNGVVDGGGDGGIDAAYVVLNGELLGEDFESLLNTQRKKNEIELILIQAKKTSGFSETALEKLYSSAQDLLDLRTDLDKLQSVYNEQLLEIIDRFRTAYIKLAARLPNLRIRYYYVTLGEEVHQNVRRKSDRLKGLLESLFSDVALDFEFVTALQLVTLIRRQPKTIYTLKLSETPIVSEGAYIALVGLNDFRSFITDEKGRLLRSLFESNVRDYQGRNSVNDDIQETLSSASPVDFWWLNNGITIIAPRPGTLSGNTLTIQDPQIVNGLQTSTEIYNFFQNNSDISDQRRVLTRIITADTPESRDQIIKATNSQTSIPIASLHATEKIHRDIEQYLGTYGLFYDRRKNSHKNDGRPAESIISIPYLAQAVMAIALQRPDSARARPSSLLKNDDDYRKIFSQSHPLDLYKICVKLMKQVDIFLRLEHIATNRKDQTNLRFYIAMLAAVRLAGSTSLTPNAVAILNLDALNELTLTHCLSIARECYSQCGASDQAAKGTELLKSLRETFSALINEPL